jgi:pSer/pThr/pTyr-binding forkhead associated (FHA) protein
MFKLILKFQDTVVGEFTFSKTPVSIGRREDNDISIDNMAVSGHHAVIESAESNNFVLVDKDSLNGTFLNERKVGRDKIFHGDCIIVGKHTIEFVDLRPEDQRPSPDSERERDAKAAAFRDTMILDTKTQQELLAKQAAEKGVDLNETPQKVKRIELRGALSIMAGSVPQIIDLSKRVTTLGKGGDADVKCSGFLVGKVAASIEKRPNGYFLVYEEGMSKPTVNDKQVTARVQLRDGDEVAVGSTRMTFNLIEEEV